MNADGFFLVGGGGGSHDSEMVKLRGMEVGTSCIFNALSPSCHRPTELRGDCEQVELPAVPNSVSCSDKPVRNGI